MVQQLRDFSDDRLILNCVYCGEGAQETRDHVPSRVFLDRPFPPNLPVVPACEDCNNSFSKDEEYLACLIECVISGSTDPSSIQNPRIAKILQKSSALKARIKESKHITDGNTSFRIEAERVSNVVLKLAAGHAAFELSKTFDYQPDIHWWPLSFLTEEERDDFDAVYIPQKFGEVGSR